MIGSPIFDEVKLHLPAGDLIIRTHNANKDNVYIQKALINGQPLNQPFLDHFQLFNATIEFWMGPTPSNWGRL